MTPHLTAPMPRDGHRPSETDILIAGSYNLGFVGVADTATTRRMLAWWQRRCAELCIVRLPEGLFVDQKWMDLVPVLFPDVTVVTSLGMARRTSEAVAEHRRVVEELVPGIGDRFLA